MASTAFKWRAFVSISLTITFLVMTLSGIMLFVSPPGRVANWSGWTILGLSKHGWEDQHLVFAIAFIVLSIFHLFVLNWKAFFNYLKSKASKGLSHPAELFASLVLFVLFAGGTLWHLPPLEQIIALGERVSNSWEYKSGGPPVPHAEAMPLDELGTLPQVGASAETMIEKLRNAGLKVQSTNQTLQEIAVDNGMEVKKLYGIIMEGKPSGGRLPGSGWGRKTLSEAAETIGVTPLALQQALKRQGIEASPEEAIRDIATSNGIEPSELVDRIGRIAEKR
ncbi:MAG TPA: DUF4405 domain-containing protein [Chlorobaculum parvum]|uniref:DUF4405 domain-containing protein n=1 Tax=Chlorobaculum parvum TaxID=274539 RepID=A0A7C5DI82_9CHLB|nr:DUF4405 domain-containing protein [Chlorobaculum parvum]